MLDDRPRGQVGELSGFAIHARTRTELGAVHVEFTFDGLPATRVSVARGKILDGDIGSIRQLEHRVSNIDTLISRTERDLQETRAAKADAERNIGGDFKYAEQLRTAAVNLDVIQAQLDKKAVQQSEARRPPTAPDPHPGATTTPPSTTMPPDVGGGLSR